MQKTSRERFHVHGESPRFAGSAWPGLAWHGKGRRRTRLHARPRTSKSSTTSIRRAFHISRILTGEPLDVSGRQHLHPISTNRRCSIDVRKKTRRPPFSASYSTARSTESCTACTSPWRHRQASRVALPGPPTPVLCLVADHVREQPARTRDERLVEWEGQESDQFRSFRRGDGGRLETSYCSSTWILG